jgi:Peptidoglycan-binding protein, CsiV
MKQPLQQQTPNMLKRLFTRAPLLAVLALTSSQSFAADDARWYRVELLVFSQPPAPADESWPSTPELAYPGDLQFLIQRDLLPLAPPVVHDDIMAVDLDNEPGTSVSIDPNNPGELAAPAEEASASASTGATLPDSDDLTTDEAAVEDILPTSFALLPRSYMEFRGKAAYMERMGGYKVLFHENWAQLVGPKKESPHIVLPSRVHNAGWPELQGTVQLHLARYLHLETNLWLNTRGEHLPRGWKMPPPPQPPIAPYALPEESEELQDTEPEARVFESEAFSDEVLGEAELFSESGNLVGLDPMEEGAAEVQAGSAALKQFYPYRHAVLMQQKRRMRSIEVHYLDHPLFGIVVKLTPLDEDELIELAQAEPSPGA